MFRSLVLSIVLTLAVAPDAALLCTTWCVSQVPAASACHEGQAPAASHVIRGNATCGNCARLGAVPFLQEHVRDASSLAGVHAVLAPRYPFVPSNAAARPLPQPRCQWPLEGRALPAILRV